MNNMIAFCGLDCTKCDAYIATIHNDNALREKTAELWSKMNNVTITPEMINCVGCRADGVKTPFCESFCEIRKCAVKNGFETCGSCQKLNECKSVGMIINSNSEARSNLDNLK